MTTPGAIGDIAGKTVLITGASSGIGLAAAEALAKKGARLVLVGRSADKTEAAAARVRGVAPGASVEVELCDMASLAQIRALGSRLRDRLDHLDVLLNNAGAMHTSRKETVDGFEMTFGVNHLGYLVTTLELLPLLRAAPAARVVNVASDAHSAARLDLDDLQWEKRSYRSFTSKLCNILFTRELARRLGGTAITANCLHPGVVATGFGRNDGGFLSQLVKLASVFLIDPDRGAATSVHLCASPAVDGVTGGYFAKSAAIAPRRAGRDDDAAAELWRRSAAMVGVSAEGLPDPA
jgi:retinol dehydrogenase-12